MDITVSQGLQGSPAGRHRQRRRARCPVTQGSGGAGAGSLAFSMWGSEQRPDMANGTDSLSGLRVSAEEAKGEAQSGARPVPTPSTGQALSGRQDGSRGSSATSVCLCPARAQPLGRRDWGAHHGEGTRPRVPWVRGAWPPGKSLPDTPAPTLCSASPAPPAPCQRLHKGPRALQGTHAVIKGFNDSAARYWGFVMSLITRLTSLSPRSSAA